MQQKLSHRSSEAFVMTKNVAGFVGIGNYFSALRLDQENAGGLRMMGLYGGDHWANRPEA